MRARFRVATKIETKGYKVFYQPQTSHVVQCLRAHEQYSSVSHWINANKLRHHCLTQRNIIVSLLIILLSDKFTYQCPTNSYPSPNSSLPPRCRTQTIHQPDMPLPTRAHFIANMDVIPHCHICHEPFDSLNHIPARTLCGHIFGKSCLETWINRSIDICNTCPICRTELFSRHISIPHFIPTPLTTTHNRDAWLCVLRTPQRYTTIIQKLWSQAFGFARDQNVEDRQLESSIRLAAVCLRDNQRCARHFPFIEDKHWPALIELMQEMIKKHCEDLRVDRSHDLQEVWYPKFGRALGWNVVHWLYEGQRVFDIISLECFDSACRNAGTVLQRR